VLYSRDQNFFNTFLWLNVSHAEDSEEVYSLARVPQVWFDNWMRAEQEYGDEWETKAQVHESGLH
jgi:hypothetical protein